MLKYIRIEGAVGNSGALFSSAWRIYEDSFPRCERRTLEDQQQRMSDRRYHFVVALSSERVDINIEQDKNRGDDLGESEGVSKNIDTNEVVGIICYWIFTDDQGEEYLYLEHLATSKDRRNVGFGAEALEQLKSHNLPILLEIEPPEDELTTRRKGFYERSGFVANKHNHRHTPYRVDTEDVTLRIMSYPTEFSQERYDNFCRSQSDIMPKF